jgi:hypothetical protein
VKAPDYISAIVGYRVWRWEATGLQSLNGEPWFPNRPFVASCRALTLETVVGTEAAHKMNDVPQAKCTCGVYATKGLDHLRETQYWRQGIHGKVNLWGTVVEHELGWRAPCAYPKALFLPRDRLPFSLAAIQSRLKTLIAYRAEIFVADPNGNIPLWANDSGYDSAGLDYLIKTSKQYYDRCRQERTLKKGDRVALRRVGIAVVEQVDDKDLQVVLRKKYVLKIPRNHVVWDQQNMRWEASPCRFF